MSSDWYPDPLGRAELRRHDGTGWTHEVLAGGQQSTEPLGFPLPRREPSGPPVDPATVIAAPNPASTRLPTVTAPPRGPSYASRPAVPTGGGLLIASGVLGIITGAITVVVMLRLIFFVSDVNRLTCDIGFSSCGRFSGAYVVLTIALLIGVLFIAAGIAGCIRATWGKITLIVLGALSALLFFIGVLTGGGVDAWIPVIWFALITGLAAADRPGY